MASQVHHLACIVLIITIIQYASALKCWSCSTNLQQDCDDHFNSTYLMEQEQRLQLQEGYQQQYRPAPYDRSPSTNMPKYQVCNDYLNPLNHERAVCIKVVRKSSSGAKNIVRECRNIRYGQEIGKCHEPTQRGETLEFCEFCDQDGCNSATSLSTSVLLASILPLGLLVLFRK